MSDDPTQNMLDRRSFEARVFARFDDLSTRLERLEARDYDTKPIWENAQKEIADLRVEMREGFQQLRSEMETRFEKSRSDIETLRSDMESGFEKLRSEIKAGARRIERQVDILNRNILEVHTDQRDLEERVEKLEPRPTP